jgi:hypothetical protein
MPQLILDPVPIGLVFLGIIAACLLAFEVGFRLGRSRMAGPDKSDTGDGPGGALTGGMLALLAFLLAVSMGFSADRFDSRRQNVLEEANTIYALFLQAGYLPEPYRSDARDLLREYAPLRIVPEGTGSEIEEEIAADIARSEEIQDELWAVAEAAATELEQTDLLAMFVGSVNDLITIHEVRVTAGVFARVPDTVIFFLLILAVLAVGMVGYGAGLTGKRPAVAATLLVVALGATLTLVIDLDRPREGILQVSQRPLVEVQERMDQMP